MPDAAVEDTPSSSEKVPVPAAYIFLKIIAAATFPNFEYKKERTYLTTYPFQSKLK